MRGQGRFSCFILGTESTRPHKPRMYTKGVGSVRSPVCNLIQYDPRITHDMFVDAVIDSFRAEYCVDDEVDPSFTSRRAH